MLFVIRRERRHPSDGRCCLLINADSFVNRRDADCLHFVVMVKNMSHWWGFVWSRTDDSAHSLKMFPFIKVRNKSACFCLSINQLTNISEGLSFVLTALTNFLQVSQPSRSTDWRLILNRKNRFPDVLFRINSSVINPKLLSWGQKVTRSYHPFGVVSPEWRRRCARGYKLQIN